MRVKVVIEALQLSLPIPAARELADLRRFARAHATLSAPWTR